MGDPAPSAKDPAPFASTPSIGALRRPVYGSGDRARGHPKAAERELRAIQGQRDMIEQLERDRDATLEHYAGMVPEALDELTGEERHRVYCMLRLEVHVQPNGDLEIRGVIRAEMRGDK